MFINYCACSLVQSQGESFRIAVDIHKKLLPPNMREKNTRWRVVKVKNDDMIEV